MRWRAVAIVAFVLMLVPGTRRAFAVTESTAQADGQVAGGPGEVRRALTGALTGAWVGTLEYRDYAEPPTSTKRVKMPTWLTVEPVGATLKFSYVYDDGPTKTVTGTSIVRIDVASARYEIADDAGKVESTYAIAGLDGLKQGRGVLVLTGKGTDNDAPVEVRETMRVGRNILEMTRETSADGKEFSFRHTYTFVRAQAPVTHP